MNRRKFVGTLSLAMLAANSLGFSQSGTTKQKGKLLKPRKLEIGDKVGIIAPSTNVSDPDDIRRATEILNHFQLEAVFGKSIHEGSGFRTKSRQMRVGDIHDFFVDDSVKAIFCIRGGYGSGDLLDLIDYSIIQNNPKIFVGYSDITAIHLAIQNYTNLVTFHGPVLLSAFTPYTAENFRKTLFSDEPIGLLSNPTSKAIRNSYPIRTIKSGKAEGRLTGGNLSLICSLMGTKYEIDTKDAILFIEDVGEEPFRIDRMMTQLRLAGKLSDAAAVVFGTCADCTMKSAPPAFDFALGAVLDRHLAELNVPSFYGLMIGHTSDQLTVPMSLNAEVNADDGTISINQSAVI